MNPGSRIQQQHLERCVWERDWTKWDVE
jgi:hypothetical protein